MPIRARHLPLTALQPGMVLARPLVSSHGGYLDDGLPAGHQLTAACLDKLRRGHAEVACVEEDDPRTPSELVAHRDRAASRLGEIFARADLTQSATRQLHDVLLDHRAASGPMDLARDASVGSAGPATPDSAQGIRTDSSALDQRLGVMPLAEKPVTEAEIRAGLDALPAFPSVVHDVLATIDDEDSHLRTLSDHLEHDPVLGARVLSLANRAHAHYDSEPVRDLYTAVSMVGLRRIRDIVARVALVDFVRHAGCSPSFWQHSLAVAIAAEELAELFGRDRKDCLVAGLLHDVGALWLRTCRPRELAALQAWVAHAHPVTPGHALERACFGMDHATIGRHMATAWHLPSEMAAAIGEHHQPHHNPTGALVAVTHLAELICLGLDLPPRAANRIDTLDEAVMGALGPEGLQALTDLLGVIEARYAFEVVALQESPREPDPQEAGVSA